MYGSLKTQQENAESNDYRLIDLDDYTNDTFTLLGYKLSDVLDNILLVQYVDLADETGQTVMRNGIAIPLAHVEKAWRIGRIVLAGPNCKHVKVGDHVCFPSDKGIPCSNLDVEGVGVVKDSVFLDENRIFGVCKPVVSNASKPVDTKRRTTKKRSRSKVQSKKT